MGKGAQKGLIQNAGAGRVNSDALMTRGTQDYSFLYPQLKQEALNPQGYTRQQLAYMNTASQQSAGGGAAATTGQANLEAARTRNAGGFQAAVGTANRGAQRDMSEKALQIQGMQANLQQAQRQQALSQLQSLYGTNLGSSLGFLNSSNQAYNYENQGTADWLKMYESLGQDLTKLAEPWNQAAAQNASGGGK